MFTKLILPASSAILLAALAACATHSVPIVSPPAVYSADQAAIMLARQARSLPAFASQSMVGDVNERLSIRQSRSVSRSTRTTVGSPVAPEGAAEEADPITLPEPPAGDISRTFESKFRDMVTRGELIRGYELLYGGDVRVLNKTYKVGLLRFNVTIPPEPAPFFGVVPDILGLSEFRDFLSAVPERPSFRLANFRLDSAPAGGLIDAPLGQDILVYSLSPEYSSLVAEESLASLLLQQESFSASASDGLGMSGTVGQFNANLSELGFKQLVEKPLQFAIHGVDGRSFSVVFGPRRKIVKRAWTNPKRWFGDSYRIDYEFEPGPRHVTAMVLIPKGVDTISISVLPQDTIVQEADILRTAQRFTKPKFDRAETEFTEWSANKQNNLDVADEDNNPARGFSKWTLDTALLAVSDEQKASITKPKSKEAGHSTLEEQVVYAQTSSTLIIETKNPVSSETRAYVGPVAIPVAKTDVLGRYRLVLTIDKSKSLEGRLTAELARFKLEKEAYQADQKAGGNAAATAVSPRIPVRIITPGSPIENLTVQLAAAPGEAAKPFVTLSEKAAGAGTTIELTFNTVALRNIEEIRFGAYVIPKLKEAQESEVGKDPSKPQVISFVIPEAPKQASGPVSIETDYTGADAKKRTHTEKNIFQYTL